MVDKFPLAWPAGWPRAANKRAGKFGTMRQQGAQPWSTRGDLTMQDAVERVAYELTRLGINPGAGMIISSNVRPNVSGWPRGDVGDPIDAGVAVYFQKVGGPMRVIAIDVYRRVRDNLAAVAATLEAMRAIERHGGAQILERAFTGFDALPAPDAFDAWAVLGIRAPATADQIDAAFRAQAHRHHPDKGGSPDAFAKLTRARDELKARL